MLVRSIYLRSAMASGIDPGTRRKYIPVGSTATSMSQTVPEPIPESIWDLLWPEEKNQ